MMVLDRDATVLQDLQLYELEQELPDQRLENPAEATRTALMSSGLPKRVKPGMSICIGAGSRGIANMPTVLRVIAEVVRELGGMPFFIPAMGSHGGATAEGQRTLLADLGITEATVGAPIRATMETVQLGETPTGLPVFMDRYAAEADGLIVVNRVKSHTDHRGETESGLTKMLAIGFGKQQMASRIHPYGAWGLTHLIPMTAEVMLRERNVLIGVALIDNAYAETAEIHAIEPENLREIEKGLLKRAKALSGSLPFDEIDVCILLRIGKEISGTGLDLNLVARIAMEGVEEPATPKIRTLAALDLTEASRGNAVGIGLCDLTVKRLADKIDFEAMYANSQTATFFNRCKLPMVLPTDRHLLQLAVGTLPDERRANPRLCILRDTLHLDRLWVSPALVQDVKDRVGVRVVSGPHRLCFDSDGALVLPGG
ncbi:MAG: lactate racemase domain-containing protein [Candidatus Zipacnadales bacterium]